MSRSMLFSTSHTGEYTNTSVPLTWNGKNDHPLKGDSFTQQGAFPVSSELLTNEFVRKHVRDAAKKAVLRDLTQPHSDLVAVLGEDEGLQIFDKTHRTWVAFDNGINLSV